MEDMEAMELSDGPPRFITEMADAEEAGKLRQKGYNYTDISDKMEITPARAKELADEYAKYLKYTAEQDPYFLERVQLNTLNMLSELEDLSKESWETVEIATQHGMVGARTQALKLVGDVIGKKSQLYQLTGQQGSDAEYIQRMQKAEMVNQIVTKVVREVVSECPRCSELSRVQLAEAFELIEEDMPDEENSDENETENSDENGDENA